MTDASILASLRRAVEAAPDDAPLRLHPAALLVEAGQDREAVSHLAVALQQDPSSTVARRLMTRVLGSPQGPAETGPRAESEPAEPAAGLEDTDGTDGERSAGFDWTAAEKDVGGLIPAMFTDSGGTPPPDRAGYEVISGVTLADVGGMAQVKQRLEAAFLAPLRNEKLRRLYGKSLRGGLLLYGPPGCGKAFLARAVAGELGARFLAVSLTDVLDMWLGQSERNLHELFQLARRAAPCVLFLDEIDAIGHKRPALAVSAMRSTVNQLLAELEGVSGGNEGVFVLAATNAPWDVDPALKRPGRLDRTLRVLPPDTQAREHILGVHLRDRPVAGADLAKLAAATDGYSGADLAHLCETAAEQALLDSARRGQPRLITMADLEHALTQVRPSVGPWLETARNVALFANEAGQYDELAGYLRKRRLL